MPDGDAFEDDHVLAEPGEILDPHRRDGERLRDDGHIRVGVLMVVIGDEDPARHQDVLADKERRGGLNLDIRLDERAVADMDGAVVDARAVRRDRFQSRAVADADMGAEEGATRLPFRPKTVCSKRSTGGPGCGRV